ncbi:MBL fold metallo-hydrolase [Caminibacter mediatlanticus]|uniref:Metallo-beta-lactamase superfamily protein n=1 Tax=Caminibacter mediatlanticus TB-2 TaxID=391592 RepID=A0AAI9AHH5_9BACT|nr:MBL fold metallo-hydrolase [Caminibacter mediatlanticus]EDM23602.1 metallo-beta-lactamase superfamily protein [Caminibacter mediatlanticus TB-2]
MKFSIVFDNYIANDRLESFWGFSLMIEDYFLFDTGSNGRALVRNMAKMGFSLQELKYLFISHPHWDHIGGIDSVIDENRLMSLFLPDSLSKFYVRDLRKLSREVKVISNPQKLFGKFYSTGIMEPIGEQSIIIEEEDFLIVVTGCAHPGVVNIVQRAIDMFHKPVLYVIGGFHLMRSTEEEINNVIKNLKSLGVEYVTPTHCSGDLAIEMFKDVYKDNYIPGGVGRIIEF